MNKFEFLYSDDKKYIPVHLQKMNYGYAPLNGLREPEQENILVCYCAERSDEH